MTPLPPATRARRAALPVALCAGLTAMLTACGEDPDAGTNGVGKLSATEIETKARATADAAVSVRLSGTLVSKGGTYKLNMRLKHDGGTGSVTSKDNTFEVLRVGKALYLKADAGFWSGGDGKGDEEPSETDAEAAGKLDDKYVKVPEGDPAYNQFRGFTDMDVLLEGLLGMQGELSKGDRTQVGGVRTIKVLGGEGEGGTLDVALVGKPYPLQFARAGGAGVLTLGDWDKDFPLAAPSKDETVDYGRQLPKTSD
ncbi:hypothetical protein SLUN_26130 [Streptomyces lunaelactis]|uniref:Lipoprotein n=1 Tax=Streptomyces lunaelactis TaxID=1535768 RepID=A0A2R4TEY6_9ACTN|nr:hypothetical protein [Streptomyces lunaelactis]AVZ77651.1 hypothetical protein SLUN_26130 [Streptomyces lunaelactis]NUK88948.1 hypothetical protein [Streptomyces lunaelactis]NUL06766.1 hypothetical protein [Streptomyces lunaelactis]